MQKGAIEIKFNDGSKEYAVLTINEFRNDGPRFELPERGRGKHLLSADDVRGNWNAWVGKIVRRQGRLMAEAPEGVEVY